MCADTVCCSGLECTCMLRTWICDTCIHLSGLKLKSLLSVAYFKQLHVALFDHFSSLMFDPRVFRHAGWFRNTSKPHVSGS